MTLHRLKLSLGPLPQPRSPEEFSRMAPMLESMRMTPTTPAKRRPRFTTMA